MAEFHASRDYFECHELLEEYWKESPAEKRSIHWVGLIQLAVALYHQRRGNEAGAKRLIANSLRILRSEKQAVCSLGLSHPKLIELIETLSDDIEAGLPYRSVMLPITDEALKEACLAECRRKGYTWGKKAYQIPFLFINTACGTGRMSLRNANGKLREEKAEADGQPCFSISKQLPKP